MVHTRLWRPILCKFSLDKSAATIFANIFVPFLARSPRNFQGTATAIGLHARGSATFSEDMTIWLCTNLGTIKQSQITLFI